MRIDKFLSECTPYSRKEIKKLIKDGAVSVNGEAAEAPDMKVDEQCDRISVSGRELQYKKYIYLMMNKPAGYVCAAADKHYPTVTELIPAEYAHYNLFSVGRLDIDTEGLLILTNDGDYAHKMTSPKKDVYKKYFAVLESPANEADIKIFRDGIQFKDYKTKPAVLEITEKPNEVYISICEGKFHQVKKMCAYIGKNVKYLKRVSIGDIALDPKLETGMSKEISV